MQLTRRDVLAALAAGGVAVAAADVDDGRVEAALLEGTPLDPDPLSGHVLETLVAVAEVVYPSTVEGVDSFVEQYSVARLRRRPADAGGVADAVTTLDQYSREWFDGPFRSLDAATRATLLDQMAVDTADPDPTGEEPARVRHFVVNELLFALYASPTGGRLVGIENPLGHPGGTASYQRGPPADVWSGVGRTDDGDGPSNPSDSVDSGGTDGG